MSITLHYFAWLRERTGISSEQVDLPEQVETIADLFEWLSSRGEEFDAIGEHRDIIQVAIDQQHQRDPQTNILDAREIALFPPMTGG